MALAIEKWKKECGHFRCVVLAHRKELVRQNHDEMLE
jgi:superfamily II DNA or RNA helicase